MHSNPEGNTHRSAQNADQKLSRKPSIKSPKPRNYWPSTSINGSSIPPGFTVFANGSLNQSKTQGTGAPIANAPDATAAGGIIYEHGGIYASVIDKWIGARAGLIDTKGKAQNGLDPFNQLDVSIGYTVHSKNHFVPPVKFQLSVTNLADSRKIFSYYGTTAEGTALWNTQPGRGFFGSISVPLGF